MVPIPEPLRDRMEVIELAGYTGEEKLHIAYKYVIPKQAAEHGLKVGEQLEFTDEGLREIIQSFTREAGVRNPEREIATITRKQARRIAEGKTEKMVVTPEVVREFLGVPKFRTEKEVAERVKKPGVAGGGGRLAFGGPDDDASAAPVGRRTHAALPRLLSHDGPKSIAPVRSRSLAHRGR